MPGRTARQKNSNTGEEYNLPVADFHAAQLPEAWMRDLLRLIGCHRHHTLVGEDLMERFQHAPGRWISFRRGGWFSPGGLVAIGNIGNHQVRLHAVKQAENFTWLECIGLKGIEHGRVWVLVEQFSQHAGMPQRFAVRSLAVLVEKLLDLLSALFQTGWGQQGKVAGCQGDGVRVDIGCGDGAEGTQVDKTQDGKVVSATAAGIVELIGG